MLENKPVSKARSLDLQGTFDTQAPPLRYNLTLQSQGTYRKERKVFIAVENSTQAPHSVFVCLFEKDFRVIPKYMIAQVSCSLIVTTKIHGQPRMCHLSLASGFSFCA